MMLLAATAVRAQIQIGGNVYGGGNAGDTNGNTNVTIREGDLNRVYGGARMADVKGRAFTNIDGAHASSYIVINRLYGGNDIAGTIGTSNDELPEVIKSHATNNNVDKTWNVLLFISTKTVTTGEGAEAVTTEADDAKKIYIGQLFGGGDGEYEYGSKEVTTGEGDEAVTQTVYFAKEDGEEVATSSHELTPPVLGKTFLDIHGGSIVYAYGGGNNATVTEKTVISLDNPSKVVSSIIDTNNPNANTDPEKGAVGEILTNDRFERLMGINTTFSYPSSDAFQIGRLFGGNNKADMAIRPRWNLQRGSVRNLYGGGNEGRMTSPEGLLLQVEGEGMRVDNVFGGCRKADVHPLYADGTPVPYEKIALDPNPNHIPAGYAARVRVLAGHVNNVYGGNDISGNVYGGNTVGILTHIYGDVYGGGNGSYAYTDNPLLKDDPHWSDFYYNPDEVLTAAGVTVEDEKLKSATALNLVRPNAEKVSILVKGEENNPTIVDGGLYVGGNSASLRENVAGASSGDQTHIKIGSYVIIDNVFLGNNGENMVKTDKADAEGKNEGVLRTLSRTDLTTNQSKFNSMDLKDGDVFAKYMEGCAMKVKPSVVFESRDNGDGDNYVSYSTKFGSFYCGGNVGSIIVPGKITVDFNDEVIIYDKIVGGCNNANVYEQYEQLEGETKLQFNAEYLGGLLGDPDPAPTGSPEGAIGDKLELNFSGLKIQPMRWKNKNDKSLGLVWNTVKYNAETQQFDPVDNVAPTDAGQSIASTDADIVRRLKGGNIYGGCYESGHVNGNVILNINETLMERDNLFDETDEGDILYENTEKKAYNITKRNTGVILSEQGMDVLGDALNVFGAGYGADSEIWGSTTINLNKGYVFQIFGGGEMGAIGNGTYNQETQKIEYTYDEKYSTYINLNGNLPGEARRAKDESNNNVDSDMAECEFIYGGAFEGAIAGSTHIYLGNGRIFNSFAGSCNADILGHTETYVGLNRAGNEGFPWIRDHIYGGNDLGGNILATNSPDFSGRIREDVKAMVVETHPVSSYMEYNQGRVRNILGGCFGDYDYNNDPAYKVGTDPDCRVASKPYLHNAFVNIRPNTNANNVIERVFGAGEGYPGDRDGDKSQDHSYVLIDIPSGLDNFANTEIFGAGAYNGLGMRYSASETFGESFNINEASAVIDLLRGRVGAAYGGSLDEGITRRTLVNVPQGSTIIINNIFGGAYGKHILPPCDVYEANVNYRSANARLNGKIYGGNNNVRRTIYATVNVSVPVLAENGYSGTVYGAGKGMETWAEYTKVNLEPGANVWEVYGGSEEGNVLNAESVEKYMQAYSGGPADKLLAEDETEWTDPDKWVDSDNDGTGDVGGTLKDQEAWKKVWKTAWTIGDYYIPNATYNNYVENEKTNLTNTEFVRPAEMDDRDYTGYSAEEKAKRQYCYNTNVIINEGATVGNYAYGGGYGKAGAGLSGGVFGTTYIALLGGTVIRDIYAACTSGEVVDVFGVGAYNSESNPKGFTASANAYIQGGTCRNVYGAGWKGNVGSETLDGETHVVIGNKTGTSFTNGIPAIQRNAYAGGEGETKNNVTEGSTVFGAANVTLYNGYIGYTYNEAGTDDPATTDIDEHYQENIHDETATDYVSDDGIVGKNRLVEAGNIFGSGYVDHSDVDRSYVTVYDGVVRNSVYGGGEIGCVGRGNKEGSSVTITKGGATHVSIYGGLVIGDVFGGGRGYDNLQRVGLLGTAGYIYGTTEVNIHRGRIGTEASVAEGRGNVFGGGNLGYVYGTSTKSASDGYYYNGSHLSEDCKVVVSPYVVVTKATTVNGHSYAVGDLVPTEVLNTLSAGDSNWKTESGGNFDDLGITIGNAVFAGGNVLAGSDAVYANTNTVFGNATASVTDVFNKDLVAIGGDGVGGLYGDGNLTLVDGYRELNITNYGTDYYNLNSSISYEDYQRLNDRERAYFELQYQAKSKHTYSYYRSKSYHNYGDVTYHMNQKITPEEYSHLSSAEKENWEEGNQSYEEGAKINEEEYELLDEIERANWDLLGFCTLYAGRIMNTIQRADFCGVFGSRIVLRGARDRVVSAADYTNYTINRVDELSLNCVTKSSLTHGNYFGIYSVVNYLGALTSDVKFRSTRTTKSTESIYSANNGETYFDWKQTNLNNRKRNNGSSLNEVALSSGVWLEILDKRTETENKKVYGPITGVVELALINVATGEGGGYVYAKNMHGKLLSDNSASQVTLSTANQGAVSYKQYTYEEVTTADKMQTSGNFVNSVKRIVDDCYPQSGSFYGTDAAPAHYWYIRGDFYLYEQYISAYTGSAQAYAEQVSIPLTITPESQGRLTLKDIHENLYAYWTDDTPNLNNYKSQVDDEAIIINDITYHKNDPISYWDYSRLNDAQKAFFLGKTYVSLENMTLSNGTYTKGQVLTTAEYGAVPENEYVCTTAFTTAGGVEYEHGKVINQNQYGELTPDDQQHFETAKSLVHVSNAMSHDNGFLLSFVWDNPDVWNNYYQRLGTGTPQYVRSSKYDSDEFASSRDNYTPSPTFKCDVTGVFGQFNYQQGNLIDDQVYSHESAELISKLTQEQKDAQAQFEVAYVTKDDCDFTVGDVHYYYVAGAPVPKTLWDTFGAHQDLFDVGYICTRTYQISDSEYILNGDVMTKAAYNALPNAQKEVMSPAYICTKDGAWGGRFFESGTNYPAVEFSNLSKDERAHFSYNYDALDLLSENFVDNGVSAKKYQGETHGITDQIPYCEKQAIDYTATYSGTASKDLTTSVEVKRGSGTMTTSTLQPGDVLTNTVYESLVNEQLHYSPIVVSGTDDVNTVYYVVNEGFQVADNWYNVGNKMSAEIYEGLTANQKVKVTPVSRSSLTGLPSGNDTKSYYFCTSSYVAKTQVKDVRANNNTTTTYAVGETVPVGAIIGSEDNQGYGSLKNEHTGFTIDGIIPTETSTLYVSRETDIYDLSQDKIVTVEYWYEYVESDETGNSYETIRERHVVNIRIHFESGVPIIGELLPPRTVLPGDVLGLNQPSVTKGAYEILGGGWETYSSQADAISHKNGTPYVTNQTPMYWYQNGNYVAYYAKTYLGKTYSNAVQISVANYHDMDKVMQDAEHHMYVDNPRVKRNSKIYIDNRECVSDPEKGELDLFSDFFSLSTGAALTGHGALDEHVKDCQNLDFILYSDVAPKKYTSWTPIGNAEHCFAGWLHGSGYTVSGLDKSLFGKLCGNIYNIGVMGSFTSGGVADSGSGHIENTWVSTTATPTGKPVIGDAAGTPYVYNSYYPEEQNWTDHTAADNLNIIEKPMEEFVNGQVAYLLNSNYLQARYLLFGNKSNAASTSDKVERPVFFSYPDGTLDQETVEDVTKNKEYQLSYTTNTTEWPWHSGNGFVEDYMGNGDYRYSDGIIPRENDVSFTGTELFVPVFPDDYIFFGQTLSYDLYTNGERGQHDTHPTGVAKYHTMQSGDEVDNSKHLLLSLEPKTANRVFRAPAYFGNGTFGKSVTFNASATFAGSYTDKGASGTTTYNPHEGLTAIDFTGKGDITGYSGVAPGAEGDFKNRSNNYSPLLDYYGLDAFRTSGITKNLLVYVPSAAAFTGDDDGNVKAQTAATKTLGVLNSYFNEPEYSEKEDDATTGMKAAYRAVDVVPEAKMPKGHLVQMSGYFATAASRNYLALTDHFLVDKQDFNAPIRYTFGDDNRMWYQRTPDNYVDEKKGWEAVSLPFSVELVTTPDKGEITHFYNGSTTGHEYWLREFKGGSVTNDNKTFVAAFEKPQAGTGKKDYTNTFLWDYYYNYSYLDKNTDEYQKTYYKEKHSYGDYAFSAAGTPYITGFPGSRYYEFDLSGQFVPKYTHRNDFEALNAQSIIFASDYGAAIGVSDNELVPVTANGYRFMPNYCNTVVTAGEGYVLAGDGGSFDKNTADVVAEAFRPYFKEAVNGTRGGNVERIVFGNGYTTDLFAISSDPKEKASGTLNIYARKSYIIVESSLSYTEDVRIVTPAGITVAAFPVKPGQTIQVRADFSGMYVVHTEDGRYIKKVAVRK